MHSGSSLGLSSSVLRADAEHDAEARTARRDASIVLHRFFAVP